MPPVSCAVTAPPPWPPKASAPVANRVLAVSTCTLWSAWTLKFLVSMRTSSSALTTKCLVVTSMVRSRLRWMRSPSSV